MNKTTLQSALLVLALSLLALPSSLLPDDPFILGLWKGHFCDANQNCFDVSLLVQKETGQLGLLCSFDGTSCEVGEQDEDTFYVLALFKQQRVCLVIYKYNQNRMYVDWKKDTCAGKLLAHNTLFTRQTTKRTP